MKSKMSEEINYKPVSGGNLQHFEKKRDEHVVWYTLHVSRTLPQSINHITRNKHTRLLLHVIQTHVSMLNPLCQLS